MLYSSRAGATESVRRRNESRWRNICLPDVVPMQDQQQPHRHHITSQAYYLEGVWDPGRCHWSQMATWILRLFNYACLQMPRTQEGRWVKVFTPQLGDRKWEPSCPFASGHLPGGMHATCTSSFSIDRWDGCRCVPRRSCHALLWWLLPLQSEFRLWVRLQLQVSVLLCARVWFPPRSSLQVSAGAYPMRQ